MLPNNDLFDFGRRNLTAGRIMRSGRQINWPRISTLPSSCFPSSISRVVYGSEHRNLGHSSAEPLDERVLVGIGFVKFAENAKFSAYESLKSVLAIWANLKLDRTSDVVFQPQANSRALHVAHGTPRG